MPDKITILWFRQDLRLSDNPALFHAAKAGAILPIYILDDEAPGEFKMGSASRWWLHHSLTDLNTSLDDKLNVYIGSAKDILLKLARNHTIDAVYCNNCYEPWHLKNDAEIKDQLISMGIECKSFNGSLLWEPLDITKNDSTPYKVFTPFYRKCLREIYPRDLLHKPKQLVLIKDTTNHTAINDLELISKANWHKQMELCWEIGENAAQEKLINFLDNNLLGYKENRNHPSKAGVSRLSPHLHFGEISPHQIWHTAKTKGITLGYTEDLDHFLSEIGWREFSYYLLYHFPDLPRRNFQPKFDNFPWQNDATLLQAWQRGQTGYPIIDAGMRELWQTGYMHNRVRMIVASFLVKNLLLHWHLGADWFWDCLIDADLASNSASWQWVAGSGADAAPYFRIFNPILQGEKFDKNGAYTRKFVPELKLLPDKYLFKPWEAPEQVLLAAGITLGQTYPKPIISIEQSRYTALQAYRNM